MKNRFTRQVMSALAITAALAAAGHLLQAEPEQSVGTWAAKGAVAHTRTGAPSVALADGRTLLTAGMTADGSATDTVVTYDPVTNAFAAAGRLIAARVGHTATLLNDGRVLVAGGTIDGLASADLEVFDAATGASSLVGQMARARSGHAAARLADGKVLIAGGRTQEGTVLGSAELVDPASGSSTPLAFGLQQARTRASATTLIDGRVLVAGGSDGTADLRTAEIFDPFSQTFTGSSTQLSVARSGHTALLLPHNNSVLVAGGTSGGSAVASADLFLPAEFPDPYSYGTGSFAATGSMTAARAGAMGGPVGDNGYAFVAGGGSADAEFYRFATIKTDKDDYAPGEPAVITGSGWQPGEQVTLVFQEDPAVHEDYVLQVTADSAGNISWNQWAPEAHDANVRFYLMARDSKSRAQTTFTDHPQVHPTSTLVSCSPASVPTGSPTTCTATVTDTSTAVGQRVNPPGTVTFSSSGSGVFGASSCTLVATVSGQSTCSVTYTPTVVGSGSHVITGAYGGGTAGTHGAIQSSSGTFTVTVTQGPRLTVVKHVVNDNGGTALANAWTLAVASSNGGFGTGSAAGTETGTLYALQTGKQYSVSESGGPAGYSASSSGNCSIANATAATDYTCTFTNDDVQPKLIVIKNVVNDNGGTKTAADFTMSVTGTDVSPASFPGAVSPGTTVGLDVGSYSVGETPQSGYAVSYSADCAGSIAIGQTKTCTVTNNDIQPQLVVIKHVINDNGGTATAADFTLSVTGSSASPASFAGAEAPGTTVALNAGSYSVGETGPGGYAPTLSSDCSGSIAVGETKTCTVTNNDIQPQLVVIKHVINDNGGTATASAFTMAVTGSSPSPGSFSGAEAPGTTVNLNAGSYSVGETGPSGYASSLSADCTGTIAIGQTKTCTVTNDDIQPKLVVIKHVVNDNGGTATSSAFTMSVTGSSPSPTSFAGEEAPGTTVALNAGLYSVGETGPSGYAATLSTGCAGSIAVGETKTCTVTNDDIQPKLTVIKHVVNDNGGTAVAADFTMSVTATAASPASFTGAEAPGTAVGLNAGAYNVTESGPTGYAASFSADCSGSIAIGETKTCTVTNNDIQPQLIVIKHVVNDNGGAAAAANFTMSVTGASAAPASFPGAEAPGTTVGLNAGTYSVSETGPGGYAATYSPDCSGTIAVGQTKSCTVTNDDVRPQLIVVKTVMNDNGGAAVAGDFTMSVAGTAVSPVSFPGAATGTSVGLNAGSYSVTESGPSGYAATFSADCTGTIAIGQTKTCTVTNNDIQPQLTVVKLVVNNNGGTATAGAFTINVTGTSPSPASFPGAGGTGTTVALNAGSYSVTEAPSTGYATAFSADCAGTIAIGETKTCTITNDDIQPRLIVIKHVINDQGGIAVASNFTMNVTGSTPTPSSFLGAEAPGTLVSLNAGTYNVTETGPGQYRATFSADCSGTIAVGQTKTCTVTNDDTYLFAGFFSPLDDVSLNLLHLVKAGQTIPHKWRLYDGQGNLVRTTLAVTNVAYKQVACTGTLTTTPLEGAADDSGQSGLRYDLEDDQFVFNWQTNKNWANKCFEVTFTFNDGTSQSVRYKFTR